MQQDRSVMQCRHGTQTYPYIEKFIEIVIYDSPATRQKIICAAVQLSADAGLVASATNINVTAAIVFTGQFLTRSARDRRNVGGPP
jgi:hypothetical protein